MVTHRLFPQTTAGTIARRISSGLLVLGCIVLSLGYQRPTLWCGGELGAGFPLPVVCDSSGGSPISSWGRIDRFDVPAFGMLIADMWFYAFVVFVRFHSVAALRARTRAGRRQE